MDALSHATLAVLLAMNVLVALPRQVIRWLLQSYLGRGYTSRTLDEFTRASHYVASLGSLLLAVPVATVQAVHVAIQAKHSIAIVVLSGLPVLVLVPLLGWLARQGHQRLEEQSLFWGRVSVSMLIRVASPCLIGIVWIYTAIAGKA